MSNQLQITGGAKVRALEGVITGTSGVLGSVPLGAANGVATLDSGGKVPVSQLPSSVVTYLGTWNAATNTPTLTNGVGDAGDMYICNVAGTVNFGAGPVVFAVGDWVLYGSGTWQKSSGQNGTVTSVGATITGGAIGITGSPITTAGTLAFAFAGTSGQYVNGAGNLTTFPTLITSIGLSMPSAFSVANSPLTANGSINVTGAGSSLQYIDGTGSLQTFPTIITEAQNLICDVYNETGATLTKGTVVYINGGHGNLPTVTKALATSDATSAQTFGIVQANITNNNNGHVVVIGNLTDLDTQTYAEGTQLYLSSTTAGAYTSVKQYAPAHLVYVAIVVRSHPTQGIIQVKIQNGFEMDELHNVYAQSPANGGILQYVTSTGLWTAVAGTTTNIAEGTNLYYTDARSRAALSFTAGSGAYNSTTGVITIPTNNNQITNGSNYITLTSLSFAAGSGAYNSTTGVITIPTNNTQITNGANYITLGSLSAGAGISYNNVTGVITSTITQYTDALARAAISLTTTGTSGAATYNSTTGVLNIPQYIGGVTSVFGRTGAVVATEGDYTLTQLGDVTITSPTTNQVLKYNGTTWINDTDANTGTVTSVGLSAPTGFSVTGSPVTSSGTLALAFASGYSLPTNVKQTNWDDAYTWVAAFPTQTGNNGKYLTTNGSVLSWADNPLGTVTSVAMTVPTGLSVSGSPITSSGTLAVTLAAGYSIPTTASQTNWDTAYTNRITSATSPLSITSNVISISQATISTNGYLSSTDWNTFNGKGSGTVTSVAALTLGTSGTDLSSSVATGTTTPVITLNVPTASATNRGVLSSSDWTTFNNKASALSGTINTIAYWDSATTIASLALATYPSLTELSYVKGVTSAIQTQLNAKQGTLTLTTTGTSGAATLVGNTLNIPQYSGGGGSMAIGGSITSATAGSVLYAGASGVLAQDNATFFWDSTNKRLGIGTTTPSADLTAYGSSINGVGLIRSQNGSQYMQMFNEGSGGDGVSGWANAGILESTGTGGMVISSFGGAITFQTSGTRNTRMTLTSGGSFGIGTTTIGSTLQVNGSAAIGYSASTAAPSFGLAVSGAVTISNSQSATYALNSTGTILVDKTESSGNLMLRLKEGTRQYWDLIMSLDETLLLKPQKSTSTEYPIFYIQNASGSTIFNVNTYTGRVGIGVGNTAVGSLLQVNGSAAIGYSTSTAAPNNGLVVSGIVGIGTTSTKSYSSLTNNGQFVNLSNIIINAGQAYTFNKYYNSGTGTDKAVSIGYAADFYLKNDNGSVIWRSTAGSVSADADVTMINRFEITSSGEWKMTPSANTAMLSTTGAYSLTGANAQSLLDLAGTWNTTGNPTAIKLNITNTASGATSNLMDLQVGGVSKFKVDKAGFLTSYNTFNTQTASYTLALTDASKIVEMNPSATATVTVPLNSSVAFPIGTEIAIFNYSNYTINIAATSGVTIRSLGGYLSIYSQYTGATLIKRGTDEWYLIGSI